MDDKVDMNSVGIFMIGIVVIALCIPIGLEMMDNFTNMEFVALNGSTYIVNEAIDENVMLVLTILVPIFAIIGIITLAIKKTYN